MKQAKKLLSSLLAGALLLSSFGDVALAAPSFKDIRGHWASSYITNGASHGYINGYEDGTFRPDNPVTRAEFTKMINNSLGLQAADDISFYDVSSGNWYFTEVRRGVGAGYISGYEDQSFRANNLISRQEAAVILSRIVTQPDADKSLTGLTDYRNIATWAQPGAKMVYSKGYMAGDDFHNFNPQQSLTRGEAAKIIEGILNGETIQKADQAFAAGNQTLEDTIYVGNVTVNSGSNDKDVTFNSCRILGTLQVNGGDVINLEDTGVNKLEVKNTSHPAGILATGASKINRTTLSNPANLTEEDLEDEGFVHVTLSGAALKNGDVNLEGNFASVRLNSQSNLNLLSGSIQDLYVTSGAKDSNIDLSYRTVVEDLTVDAACDFTGEGTIENATVDATGVTFENPPENLTGISVLAPTMSPRNGSSDAAVDTDIRLTFPEDIYTSSGGSVTASYVENSLIEIRRGSATGTKVSFDASVSRRVITLDPDYDLTKATKYYVIIKSALETREGMSNSKLTYSFETEGGGLNPITYPVDGSDTIPVNAKITLTFPEAIYKKGKQTLSATDIQNTVVEIHKNSLTGELVPFSAAIDTSRKVITLTPKTKLTVGTEYHVILLANSIADEDDGTNERQTFSFTTAATETLVPKVTPPSGSNKVEVNTNITLAFDVAVYTDDGKAVTSDYLVDEVLTLRRGSATGTIISIGASIDSTKKLITIEPTNNLSTNTTYYLTVTNSTLGDSTGAARKYNSKMTFNFETGSAAAKAILEPDIIPSRGATEISTATNITLTFPEEIYQSSDKLKTALTPAMIQNSVVEIWKDSESGSKIAFTAAIDVTKKIVTLTPTAATTPLQINTRYYVVVKEDSIQNADGRKNDRFVSYFYTGSSTQVLKATPVPADGAFGVDGSKSIILTFDEALYHPTKMTKLDRTIASDMEELSKAFELHPGTPTAKAIPTSIYKFENNRVVTLTWTGVLPDGLYYLVLPEGKLKNANGIANKRQEYSFTVGNVLGIVVSPKNGETNIPRNTSVNLAFGERILTSSNATLTKAWVLDHAKLYREVSSSNLVPVDLSATLVNGDNSFSVTPVAPLQGNTPYVFVLTAGSLRGSVSNKTNGEIRIRFTTDQNITVPTVIPANGTTNVPPQTDITLHFGEVLYYRSSPTATTNLLLSDTSKVPLSTRNSIVNLQEVPVVNGVDGTPVPVQYSVKLSSDGRSLVIDPDEDLKQGVKYLVTLNEGKLTNSTSNNKTNAALSSYFTTMQPKTIPRPAVDYNGINSQGKTPIVLTFEDVLLQKASIAFDRYNALIQPIAYVDADYIQKNLFLYKDTVGSTPLAYTVEITEPVINNAKRTVLTITPVHPLVPASTYYLSAAGDAFSAVDRDDTSVSNPAPKKNYSFDIAIPTNPPQFVVTPVGTIGENAGSFTIQYDYPGKMIVEVLRGATRVNYALTGLDLTSPRGTVPVNATGLSPGTNYDLSITLTYKNEKGENVVSTPVTYRFTTYKKSNVSTLSGVTGPGLDGSVSNAIIANSLSTEFLTVGDETQELKYTRIDLSPVVATDGAITVTFTTTHPLATVRRLSGSTAAATSFDISASDASTGVFFQVTAEDGSTSLYKLFMVVSPG